MLKPIIVGGFLVLAGCAHQPEVTLLLGPRADNYTEGHDFGATVMILQQIGESRVRCGFAHSSTVENGKPFNPDRTETTFDQIGCGPRFGGKRLRW